MTPQEGQNGHQRVQIINEREGVEKHPIPLVGMYIGTIIMENRMEVP